MKTALMKKIAIFILALALSSLGFVWVHKQAEKSQELPVLDTQASEGLVLLELFTSQGCSSCPPADRVLQSLIEEGAKTGSPVIGLSFHVDYWDYLGWKDPFGNAAFSQRQRNYARALRSNVYTPQLVINGKRELVGSYASRVKEQVKQARLQKPSHQVGFEWKLAENQKNVQVDFTVLGDLQNKVMNLALVEKGLQVQIKRGENGGRTLPYDNVVRQFDTQPLKAAQGSLQLSIPEGLDLQKSSLVLYVQDANSLEVLGASQSANLAP